MNDMDCDIADALAVAFALCEAIGPIYDDMFATDDARLDLWLALADALHNLSEEYATPRR